MRTFLLSAVFAVMVSLTAFAGPPSVVLMQYRRFDSYITVTRGVGKTETVKLEPDSPKHRQANAETLQTVFANLYAEGYTLQGTSVSGSVLSWEVITYVLVKP